jgi:hypothetical protein
MGMSPRLLRPRATGFNPKSISGLFAWYDASAASTLTISGTSVTAIADQSGNGRNAVQDVGSYQPIKSTLGSKTAIAFAPQNLLAAVTPYTITAQSVFCVFKCDGLVAYARIIAQESDTLNAVHIPLLLPNPASYAIGTYAGGGFRSQVFITQSVATIGESHHDGSAVTCYANGVAGNSFSSSLSFSPTKLLLGNSGALSNGLTGVIGEVLVWNRALTSAEIVKTRKYLSAKWGISVS